VLSQSVVFTPVDKKISNNNNVLLTNYVSSSGNTGLAGSTSNLRTSVSSSTTNIPLGNYQFTIIGSSLPPIKALFDSSKFQFSGCNTMSVQWTANSNGIFRAGSYNTYTKNQCNNNNDQQYLQTFLGGNGYVRNGNYIYLTKNGKNIAYFSPINGGSGSQLSLSSNPQITITKTTKITTSSGRSVSPGLSINNNNNPGLLVITNPGQSNSYPNNRPYINGNSGSQNNGNQIFLYDNSGSQRNNHPPFNYGNSKPNKNNPPVINDPSNSLDDDDQQIPDDTDDGSGSQDDNSQINDDNYGSDGN
jgi:hypothetical protein